MHSSELTSTVIPVSHGPALVVGSGFFAEYCTVASIMKERIHGPHLLQQAGHMTHRPAIAILKIAHKGYCQIYSKMCTHEKSFN